MSRWHARLDELRAQHSLGTEQQPPVVQNVQNVQNVQGNQFVRPFEQIEHSTAWAVQDADAEAFEGAARSDLGVPPEWAEGFACLWRMPCPPAIPPARWRELVDNAGRFIDRWAAQAGSLGWTTVSIFGCHPEAPLARRDTQGLVFVIGSGEVVAVTAATAAIRTKGGSLLTFRRMPLPPGKRPACLWEL